MVLSPAESFLIESPQVVTMLVLIPWMIGRWFIRPSDRKRTEWMLVASCLAVPLGGLAQVIANVLSLIRPLKYDEYVYQMDRFFGQPSFVLGRWVQAHFALRVLISVSYHILPMAMVGVFAVWLWECPGEETLGVLRVFLLNLCAAPLFYLIFPVCGPLFAFPHFPYIQPHLLAPHLLKLAAAPNGVPSVHASSALLCLWFLRRWRWGMVIGTIFLALTVLATLSGGEHYLFDLLCAVPYSLAVYRVGYRVHAHVREPVEATS